MALTSLENPTRSHPLLAPVAYVATEPLHAVRALDDLHGLEGVGVVEVKCDAVVAFGGQAEQVARADGLGTLEGAAQGSTVEVAIEPRAQWGGNDAVAVPFKVVEIKDSGGITRAIAFLWSPPPASSCPGSRSRSPSPRSVCHC